MKSVAVAIATVSAILSFSVPSQASEYGYFYELEKDVSQPNSTNSLVPNAGQQGDTSSNNTLQLPSPESNHSASGEASYISDDAALNAATRFAEEQLDSFTSYEDFLDNMEQAFGNDWQPQQAEDLIQDLASGDAMPKVEILPASELKANGAYGENTIYLSEEFLSNASSEKVSSVLLEEIGHYVDQELNSGDSPGDEGDIFQQLVQDKDISDGEMVDLKAEDDSGTVALDGKEITVERSCIPLIKLGSFKVLDSSDDEDFNATPYNASPTDEIRLVLDGDTANKKVVDSKANGDPLYIEKGTTDNPTVDQEEYEVGAVPTPSNIEVFGSETKLEVLEKDADGYEKIAEKTIYHGDGATSNTLQIKGVDNEGEDNEDSFEYEFRIMKPSMNAIVLDSDRLDNRMDSCN